jgi:diguanylate cyclase (GGDEF)-like protein/PAS domain S-box-containing protein
MFSGKKFSENLTETILNNVHDGVRFVDHECNIFFWNRAAEEITGYSQSDVHGKKCSENILNPVDETGKSLCDAQCPVKRVLADGQTHTLEAYILHKEGYRLPVSIRTFPLFSEKGIITAAGETFYDISPKFVMPQRKMELDKMQLLDQQTEVGNKRYLELQLLSRLEEIKKIRIPFGLLYVDIDHLNDVNETYGKSIGDQILRTVARTLSNNIRFIDIVGRWSSDEFLVIVLNVDENKLDYVGNKLRLLVEQSNIMAGAELVRVTISVGATLASRVDSVEILVSRAESLMHHSKWLGRNRVSTKIVK